MTKCNTKGCKSKRKCGTCRFYVIVIAIILIACAVFYVADYYHADEASIETYTEDIVSDITIENPEKDITVFKPQEPMAGFIFYPGGKVEASAYEPLMTACADRGILCILVKMPGTLAVSK